MEKEIKLTKELTFTDQFIKICDDILEIFNVSSQKNLLTYLRQSDKPTVCAKRMISGHSGGYECRDCEKDSSCIMCVECFEKSKDKHIGHKFFYKNNTSGCCDCGDPDSWDPKGFCPDHQGLITSDEEVKKYINNSFDEQTLILIYASFENFFDLFAKILAKYESQIGNATKENEKDRKTNAGLIQQLLSYLEQIALSNMAILNIIVEFFGKTFSFETSHVCSEILIDEKNQIKFNFIGEKKDNDEKNKQTRKCRCYFLTLLLRVWDKQLDNNFDKTQTSEKEFKVDKIFVTFLKSYKFKILYAFSYFSLIDTILRNKSEHIRSLSVQVMTIENIAEKVVSEEKLIFNFYEKLLEITAEYTKVSEDDLEYEENLSDLFNFFYEYYMQTYYLCKPKPASVLAKKFYILKILIDVVSLIQNSNKLKVAKTFQREGYDELLFYIEMYFLQMFSLLVSNMDYSDFALTQELIGYFMDKIIFEDHEIKLNENEYSFHIPLSRGLGIVLNRVCFDYQENKKLDFNETLRQLVFGYYSSLGFDERASGITKENEESKGDLEMKIEESSCSGFIGNYDDSNKNLIEKGNNNNKGNSEVCEFNINNFEYGINHNYNANAGKGELNAANQDTCRTIDAKAPCAVAGKAKKIFEISEEVYRKKYPNAFEFDEILKKILAPTVKFISFLNSIACDKWAFYGENMSFYYTLYGIFEIFSLSDFSLIKMISSLDKEGSVFNFEYFLRETNFGDTYSEFIKDNFTKESLGNHELIAKKIFELKKIHSKNFNFLLKNFEYFLKLFIPESFNNAFIRLFTFSLQKFNDNKIDDMVFEKLIICEKHNLLKLLKINLIHIIFSKENSIFFSEIMKALPFYLKKIFAESGHIDLILNEIAECYQVKGKPNVYKLKQEFFQCLDLFSYLDPQNKTTAEKHYLEFAKDKFALINSPDESIFEFIRKFESDFFEKFFCRNLTSNANSIFKNNFEFVFSYLLVLIRNYEKLELNDTFIFIFMKFFSLFLNFYKKKYGLGANRNAISSNIPVSGSNVNNNNNNTNFFEDKFNEENIKYFKDKILNRDFLVLLQENSNSKLTFSFACKYLLAQVNQVFPELKEKEKERDNPANKSANPLTVNSQADRGKRQQELMKLKFQQKSQHAMKQFDPTQTQYPNSEVIHGPDLEAKTQLIDYNLNLNEESNYFEVNSNNNNAKKDLNSENNIKNKNAKGTASSMSSGQNPNEIEMDQENYSSFNSKQNNAKKEKQCEIHCIVCKNQIIKSDIYTNPYGRIGILNSSSFLFNSKLQTIKQQFEKVILKNKLTEFHSVSIMNNLKSSIMSSAVNNNNENNNNNKNNNIYASTFSTFSNNNNNINLNANTNQNTFENYDLDISKKDSQLMFSQINNQTFLMNLDENLLLKKIMLNFKKNCKDSKKSLRYTTCNHYIHVSCYAKSLHSYINLDSKRLWFSCPLCQTISNCIFPELDINLKYSNPETKELEDVNEGITFAEIFNFLNEKKEKEIEIDYLNTHLTIKDVFGKVSIPKSLVSVCEDFIEKIISFNHNKFIIRDFNVAKLKVNSNNSDKSLLGNNSSINSNNGSRNASHMNSTRACSNFSQTPNNENNLNFINNNNNNNVNQPEEAQNSSLYANQEKYYETLKSFFINSLSLLDVLRDEDYSKELSILRIFTLSLRVLIKSGSLEFGIFLNRFWNLFYFFKTQFQKSESLVALIDNDIVSNNFFELLMLVLAISNLSECAYFRVLFKHYLPMFLMQFSVREFYKNYNFKTTSQNFENYFNVDELLFMLNSPQYSKELKEHCNFYLRKLTILSKIHEENFNEVFVNKFQSVEEEFAYYVRELGFKENFDLHDLIKDENDFYPTFWKQYYNSMEFIVELLNNYHKFKLKQLMENPEGEVDALDNTTRISPFLLLITPNQLFKFIDLPSNALDLTTKYGNQPCPNCNRKVQYAILCLICGEKICYMKNCCRNLGKNKNEFEYAYHTKICLNGEGIYLQLFNGEILATLNRDYINITDASLYLNKYGECYKEKNISMDYVLREDKLKTLLSDFKNMKYSRYFRKVQPMMNQNIAIDNDDN